MAFASDEVTIDDLKFGHDENEDDDIDDAGDDILFSETFASNAKSPAHDHAGNLVDDGRLIYKYDASALDSRRRQREPGALRGSCELAGRSFCGACGRS